MDMYKLKFTARVAAYMALCAASGWIFASGAGTLSETMCSKRWDGSGMATKWGLLAGCRVQRKDGTWIPADAYREVSTNSAPPPKTAP